VIRKTLLLVSDYDKNVYLSARNIPNAQVMVANEANTYSILNANNLIVVENAIDKLKEVLN
jgi:large subunit ribosomal protein L4